MREVQVRESGWVLPQGISRILPAPYCVTVGELRKLPILSQYSNNVSNIEDNYSFIQSLLAYMHPTSDSKQR